MNILIVDDERDQRELLKGFLEKQGFDVIAAENGVKGIELFKNNPVQLVILDHKMPDIQGDEVLKKMIEINPHARFIMVTAYGAIDMAVNVMKLGACDFMEKPVDLSDLLSRIKKIEDDVYIEEDVKYVSGTMEDLSLPVKMVVKSKLMKDVVSIVKRVAESPWSVLIHGETGTGKELVAKLVHLLSTRKEKPFIEVNCASIPENLFESEIFGHEKGAFTGAVSQRRGKFELADKGTIFLDEVGELPISLQPKLLRAIQEKRINSVGSEKDIVTDVRVVAATNRDLKKMSEQGEFREDLYYRLNVFEIEIPPLRNRKEEIPDFIEFFVKKYSGKDIAFSPDAIDILIKYPYPGNVRELEHIIQRSITLSRGRIIRPDDLPHELSIFEKTKGTLNERIEALEKEAIRSALIKYDWVQTRAAESLGISERVLRYKMEKFGIKNIKNNN